jgi:anti-sigma factor RsiW
MIACDAARSRIQLYVDNELSASQTLELEAHLIDCPGCLRRYDGLRAAVDPVRAASPLYEVSEGSFARAEQVVLAYEKRQRFRHRLLCLSAAAAVAAGVLVVYRLASTPDQPDYISFATRAHMLYASGAFPLDIHSKEPRVLSEWLNRLRFKATLPNYASEDAGRKQYSLIGGRLLQYLDQDVAYLAYEMKGKPISLLMASSVKIRPSGADVYVSGGLTFYFRPRKGPRSSADAGLRTIAWSDKGLTYILVSTLDVHGAESCVICHGARNDQPKLENLRPATPNGTRLQ